MKVFTSHIFILLVPEPFIYLALRKTSYCSHFDNFLLAPVDFALKLLFKYFDLDGTFSFSFFDAILIIPNTVILIIANLGVFWRVWSDTLIIEILIILFFHDHGIMRIIVMKIRRRILDLAS